MDDSSRIRLVYERLNTGDIEGFGDLLADDVVEHEELPDLEPTKDGVIAFFRTLRTSFPDMRMDVEDVITAGDKSVARVVFTGTHDGDFLGLAPTGARVTVPLIDIVRYDDRGLVCEHWGVMDTLSLMQQVGAVPTGPPA